MVLMKLSKEQAKEEVKKLVDKYNRIVESGSIKGYSENGTKKDFITPLFKALGWDVENEYSDDEVKNEEKVSKGRVDYSFRINGIPKFFLEAKALKEDLDNIKFVEQAINYAWHKGCTWAVLTDFEAIKIFNAEWKSTNPLQAQFGQALPCQLFLEKFDTLWLLSRESFENKLLDIEAEKWGKKIKKISVDKQLLSDLTRFRDLLNKNILKNNASKNISGDELDEAVQRIIDRLIFIRTLEDKELEAPMLQSVIREDLNKRIYKKLNLIFRKIDDIYNSKLFTPHLCENLEIDDEVLSKIINGLFNTGDNTVHYDFSAIDADVLGNIYEQYLGHILKKTDKRAKLAEGKAHRKEQGIYYTPTYVVDYIVKNTVGELAKDKKFDLKNIKILDPACGSGSFLMKAFDYLVTLDKKKNGEIEQVKLDLTGESATYGRKMEILKNNIFGVDLDPKAVEIAQLNLLLKAAEKKHRLPTLQENIKVGNSLIDDKNISPRAFKWEEEFKEIIDNGGFDVVIGNPPYISNWQLSEVNRDMVEYLDKVYSDVTEGHWDIYILFIIKSLQLLKENGYLSFIVPSSLAKEKYGRKLRELIVNKYLIISLVVFNTESVFKDVARQYTIFVIQKKTNSNTKTNILNFKNMKFVISHTINQTIFNNFHNCTFRTDIDSHTYQLIQKIEKGSKKLGELCCVNVGVVAHSREGSPLKFTKDNVVHNTYSKGYKKYIEGKDISRYNFLWNELYLDYTSKVKYFHRPKFPELFDRDKIIIRRISGENNSLIGVLDNQQMYFNDNLISVLPWDNQLLRLQSPDKKWEIYKPFEAFSLKYLIGILNSKLMNFYFSKVIATGTLQGTYSGVYPEDVRAFPIKIIPKLDQKKLGDLVDNMSLLKERYCELKDKLTDEMTKLEKEIQKLDNEIDEEVYKLYGITEEEKKII